MHPIDMDDDPDQTEAHALAYLVGAGWSPLPSAALSEIAMGYSASAMSLSLWYSAREGVLRLVLRDRGSARTGGVFRDGAVDLRFFAQGRTALGLFCWLTSTQHRLSPEGLGEWLEHVVSICPDAYALVSAPDEPERLVLVSGAPRAAPILH